MYLILCLSSRIYHLVKFSMVFHLQTPEATCDKKALPKLSFPENKNIYLSLGIHLDMEIYFDYIHKTDSQKTEPSVKCVQNEKLHEQQYKRITINSEQFQNLDEELTSPLKPYVEILAKSSNFCSLLVVNLSQTICRSSFCVKETKEL